MLDHAQAFWIRAPGRGRSGRVALPEPGDGDVLVRTLRSGVSRGTETLVFRGGVPPSQYAAMRAPFQEGDFPAPVKYGYLNVGIVEDGPPALLGRTVFCLYPHQTAYVVPAARGDRRAGRRAAGARRARRHRRDRGQRAVGRGAADRRPGRRRRRRHGRLLRRRACSPGSPGVEVDAGRRRRRPGRRRRPRSASSFARPSDAAGGRDLVVHASATSAGLQRSLELLAAGGHACSS